jgi:hypothetical protein
MFQSSRSTPEDFNSPIFNARSEIAKEITDEGYSITRAKISQSRKGIVRIVKFSGRRKHKATIHRSNANCRSCAEQPVTWVVPTIYPVPDHQSKARGKPQGMAARVNGISCQFVLPMSSLGSGTSCHQHEVQHDPPMSLVLAVLIRFQRQERSKSELYCPIGRYKWRTAHWLDSIDPSVGLQIRSETQWPRTSESELNREGTET